MSRHDEPQKGDSIEQVARLVELSSLGTVGARQLRDRTSSASRDRALLQAYFSATAEGCTWWRTNTKNAPGTPGSGVSNCESGSLPWPDWSGAAALPLPLAYWLAPRRVLGA